MSKLNLDKVKLKEGEKKIAWAPVPVATGILSLQSNVLILICVGCF